MKCSACGNPHGSCSCDTPERRAGVDALDAAQERVREASEQRTSAPERRSIMATIRACVGNMSDLTERRAEFVYEGARLAAIAAKAPIVPAPWREREEPFRAQFRKVIDRQCGPDRSQSPEELHGSWMQAYYAMGWVYGEVYDREKKVHPDLVPYAKLGQLERDKDAVFVALCEIARQWVYDLDEKADAVSLAARGEPS